MHTELLTTTPFSFLRGASNADELFATAKALGYRALAITDHGSLAGIVRAWEASKKHKVALIVGAQFELQDGVRLVVLARDHNGYSALCELVSRGRRAAGKGEYELGLSEYQCLVDAAVETLLLPPDISVAKSSACAGLVRWYATHFPAGALALALHRGPRDTEHIAWLRAFSHQHQLPLAAVGDVHMHNRERRALQDVLACIRHGCTLQTAGTRLFPNGERHLRTLAELQAIYPADALSYSETIAARCHFSLSQLNYTYPSELVPQALSPTEHLRALTLAGSRERWPEGTPSKVAAQIEHELTLVRDLKYEHFFLTVHDIVAYARGLGILCQGRGSAANSAVCYCLGITEVNPTQGHLLFERFISRERNEPPDIDVDFEHERREEVIQYIYAKYGRERAALAATVISYRTKSAVRELGKVLGLAQDQIDALVRSMAWWDGRAVVPERLAALGLDPDSKLIKRFAWLLEQLIGMPRHLSQHVGGFVISHHPLHTLVPVENAAMPDRTIIQWDKDDLEALGLLKVDVLALGMLSAIRKCFQLIKNYHGQHWTLANIPQEDTATYDMICKADTIGVFQIESRAQMTMLPRLRPHTFYDLVVEVAIVRPGPIQGGMVNPYLKRRQGLEEVSYPSEALKAALDRTLGVPVFQEQVMQIAMIAAGFDAGEADALRRSMAAWGRHGTVDQFQQKLMDGMYERGYPTDFAEAVFNQIKGFGAYGFPESHAASFALLVYASCWLKCHYPAEFTCALLNSQPMGFYPPSDLVRDAREHGVTVHPIDVMHSAVDHTLEALANGKPALRLGLRLVHSLSNGAAERIVAARQHNTFANVADLCLRSDVNKHDQQALADANALHALADNRHKAVWEILGVEKLPGLLSGASQAELPLEFDAPAEGQDIAADYRSTGLTLGRHPLALLRPKLKRQRIISAAEWAQRSNSAHVRVAGLVTVRQRPGSAKGVMFMTLEDETGRMNIVLWSDILERYRKAVLGTSLVIVAGDTQRVDGVSHLVAKKVEDASYLLGEMEIKGRNFH